MNRVPFTITNNSISFYAKGRMYSVNHSDAVSYAGLRAALQTPTDQPHDIDQLLGFVDVRQALVNQSQGQIVFIGDEIVFRGQAQHGLWVDKILEFRAAGEPFDPIWNALNRLLQNPTPEAIARLPIFLERTGLGFLPDGRFIAFKGVNADYQSEHPSPDGTRFTHQIGDRPTMSREDVDADPNETCSRGLHVGAPGYVRQYYSGGRYALVLVAVDPADVVCVPVDYQGEKMRVCSYEVIDHLAQDYSDELLGRLKTTVRGYEPAVPVAPAFNIRSVNVGDWVEVRDNDHGIHGICQVVDIDTDYDDGLALMVSRNGEEGDAEYVYDRDVVGIASEPELDEGDQGADVGESGDPALSNDLPPLEVNHHVAGWRVQAIDLGTRTYLTTRGWRSMDTIQQIDNLLGDRVWTRDAAAQSPDAGTNQLSSRSLPMDAIHNVISADQIVAGVSIDIASTAQIGDLVRTAQGGWPPTGVYPVVAINDGAEYRLTLRTEHDGDQGVLNRYVTEVISRPWMRAGIGSMVSIKDGLYGEHPALGNYEVVDLSRMESDNPQVQILTLRGPWWIAADRVTAIVTGR